jgi:hypothetical protein
MWTSRSEELPNHRGLQIVLDIDSRTATVADVLRAWQADHEFRTFFNSLLADTPYAAFRWETPSVTADTMTRPFECVVLDAPGLARSPEEAFAEQFDDAEDSVAVFGNLGRDAILVVPCPIGDALAYGHLAAFVRHVPKLNGTPCGGRLAMQCKDALGANRCGSAPPVPVCHGSMCVSTTVPSTMASSRTSSASSAYRHSRNASGIVPHNNSLFKRTSGAWLGSMRLRRRSWFTRDRVAPSRTRFTCSSGGGPARRQ